MKQKNNFLLKKTHNYFYCLIGFFLSLFLIFFINSLLYLHPIYNQFSLFSLIGVIVFFISFCIFQKKNKKDFLINNEKKYIDLIKKINKWFAVSLYIYLIFAMWILVIIGITEGFKIKINGITWFSNNPELEKVLGIVINVILIICGTIIKVFYDSINTWMEKVYLIIKKKKLIAKK